MYRAAVFARDVELIGMLLNRWRTREIKMKRVVVELMPGRGRIPEQFEQRQPFQKGVRRRLKNK